MLSEKLKVKTLSSKLKSDRILILEEIVNNLHQSYTKILKHLKLIDKNSTPKSYEHVNIVRPVTRRNTVINKQPYIPENEINHYELESQVFIYKNLNQELRLAVETIKNELKLYKEHTGKVTESLHLNHENHSKKMKKILLEYKNSCQIELQRKQEEVNRLHEILAHWIHQFVQLQESIGIPSSSPVRHRRTLSRQYVEMIKKLCEKTTNATQGKVQPALKGIFKVGGDQSPALYED